MTLDMASGQTMALDRALSPVTATGLGAYRVIEAGAKAATLAAALAERGIAVRQYPQGRLGIIPALDQIEAAAHALGTALRELG